MTVLLSSVTFAAVASAAGISRSWLYTQPGMRPLPCRDLHLQQDMPGKDPCVIIWLNDAFGAGWTMTARQLAGRLANARHFDPELVGYLLMSALGDHEFKDFQDLPPWRELVPVFTEKIAGFTGQHLIAVQTVLREDYWPSLIPMWRH